MRMWTLVDILKGALVSLLIIFGFTVAWAIAMITYKKIKN